jgi:serine hydrolase
VECAVLMIPGFTGAGPGHWQSIWERAHPEYQRVQQRDWDHPEPTEWVATLDRVVRTTSGRVVLVGHSLGCMVIAKWAAGRQASELVGAMLVAPSDVEAAAAPSEVRGFAPIPLERLPFRSLVVSSSNDPLVSSERAAQFAQAWGSRLISIGAAGHIHTAAGYGPWPEGHALLREMLSDEARTA